MELICAECKNKWMPSNRINEVICPYCGNIIGELSRDFSSFEDGIAYIRNMFGDDIFEQRRFFFICTEYCLDYYEKEISAFKILYDSGLSKRILNLRGSDEKIIVRSKKQFVYQLRMKNGMNTSWAEYVIDLFCFATGISTENEFSSNILSKVRKAENGDPEAQYQVGICYKDGKGVERSLDDAIKWLSLSAGQKYTEAMVALYHIYAKENNKNIAKKYLEEAVNYGNVNAINTLAYCLYHGDDGYKQNIEKAVALLDSGVSQKSIISMRRRADIYLKDGDVERATELLKDAGNMARSWYLKAIEQEYYKAYFNLAYYYENDIGGGGRNVKLAKEYYLISAEKGYEYAQYVVGNYYLHGVLGFEQNGEKAIEWLQRAADNGHPMAKNDLAVALFQGEECKKDIALALKLFEEAAQEKVPNSLFSLGYIYYNGQEVQKDKIKAAHYFLESANLGYAPAMMNYGYMCASGDGIRKNLDDGLFWLLSAIENGEDGAMEYLTKYYKQNRRGEWVKKLFS